MFHDGGCKRRWLVLTLLHLPKRIIKTLISSAVSSTNFDPKSQAIPSRNLSLSLSLNPQPQIQGRNQIINLCKSSISLRVSFFGIFSYLIYVDLISFWGWSGWILVELGGWWIFVFFRTWIWYLLFGFLNLLMIGISSVLNLGLGFGCNFGFICGFRFRCWFLSGKDWIFVIF